MRKFTSSTMPLVENPVAVKFSPFEALLIGEKNKVVKRKPMKNTVFITCLRHTRKKQFDLRALFDVEDTGKASSKRQKRKVVKGKKVKNAVNFKKTKHTTKPNVYCYELDGQKVLVKDNNGIGIHGKKKQKKKKKRNQANKVRFKPDFKFRETAEERIVHKMRKKRMRQSVRLSQVQTMPIVKNRHSLRGSNGRFISKSDCENSICSDNNNERSVCEQSENVPACSDGFCEASDESKLTPDVESSDTMKHLPKIAVEMHEALLNDISKQYYKSVFSDELFEFPPPPTDLTVSDFDADAYFLDILGESMRRVPDDEAEDGDSVLARRKGLKMYERKNKSNAIRDVLNVSTKENHCVNNGAIRHRLSALSEASNGHVGMKKGRRHSLNYLIDERPTKDDHLLSENKFRSLFCKTPCGSETFLGGYMKPVLLNSQFGRLPDIS